MEKNRIEMANEIFSKQYIKTLKALSRQARLFYKADFERKELYEKLELAKEALKQIENDQWNRPSEIASNALAKIEHIGKKEEK